MFAKISENDYKIIKELEKGTAKERRFAEIFKEIIVDKDFKEFVEKIRKKLNIPPEGLDLRNKHHEKLFNKCIEPGGICKGDYVYHPYISLDSICKGCNDDVNLFLEKKNNYNIENKYFYHNFHSIGLSFPLREYILTGEVVPSETEMIQVSRTFHKNESEAHEIRNPKKYEEIRREGLEPFVIDEEISISFSPHITKQELLIFIRENWSHIQKLKYNISGKEGKNKRVKSKKNFFRDIYIFQKFEELKKTKCKYPEIKLAKFLKERRNIYLSEGAIRTIVSRINKFVSNKVA